ncbi:MAG: hypothetical protein DIZ80_12025 [endosymbiont of Galathealinum brachiosum]|uniref:FecR protein domain-containing protein n=1 Tax=endosymbiont of Galathealinum brachiosum TaxID=2200906 RepID=A0A370DF43_9GAMM|nr:MAG: hypothetical protein DIZ80_12025 [endosymbiont of Galathealinum brachiosum]
MSDEIDDPRRDFLVKLLTAGAFATGALSLSATVQSMGKIPKVLPSGKSFFDISGDVKVNNVTATLDTFVKNSDVVTTGSGAHAVFVVGSDAFMLRSNSSMEIQGSEIISTIRLFSGKLLSVFGHRENKNKLHMRSATATIGIRGTGVYMEADQEQTYLCTCYGITDVQSSVDKNQIERIVSEHHDKPKYLLAKPSRKGKLIEPAPMINHTDLELALIEELVGREPPFGIEGNLYKGPRRDY